MAFLTEVERAVLRVLSMAGGRHTFRPDGLDQVTYGSFERGVVRTLYALRSKGLVSIDESASRLSSTPGHDSQFASLTAELTEAGREALEETGGRSDG